MAKLDYKLASGTYDQSRTLGTGALDSWRKAAEPFDPGGSCQIVDVGSGTGVFSASLAEWFQAQVLAVEPNESMRKIAELQRPNAHVRYVEGDASRIPALDHSCKIAWLSTVIHHVPSLADAGRELSRVLNKRGRVLVRSAFPERSKGIHLFRFFPEASYASGLTALPAW